MSEGVRVIFEGGARQLTALVSDLESEGLLTNYETPMEQRGVGQDVLHVIIYVRGQATDKVTGALLTAAATRAVAKYRKRFPRDGRADVEHDV